MSTKTDSGLSMQEVAQSAHRAYRHADPTALPWDNLSTLGRVAWQKLSQVAEATLVSLQGEPWSVVSQRIFSLWSQGFGEGGCGYAWEELPSHQKLAWEAASRHLTCLYDNDEMSLEEIHDLEASWRIWAIQRTHNITIGS